MLLGSVSSILEFPIISAISHTILDIKVRTNGESIVLLQR